MLCRRIPAAHYADSPLNGETRIARAPDDAPVAELHFEDTDAKVESVVRVTNELMVLSVPLDLAPEPVHFQQLSRAILVGVRNVMEHDNAATRHEWRVVLKVLAYRVIRVCSIKEQNIYRAVEDVLYVRDD
jgi:hypothetical protein